MKLASEFAEWSKDPGTRVGAVAVAEDFVAISSGWNGFPREFKDTTERLVDREFKLDYVAHAEHNCIYNAARQGSKLMGSTLFVHGLFPCHRCAVGIAQVGITKIVAFTRLDRELKREWADSCQKSMKLFDEVGIGYIDWYGSFATQLAALEIKEQASLGP